MTTRLLWHSKLSKKNRAAAVEAARRSGYPEAQDDGPGIGGLRDLTTAFRRAKLLAGWKNDVPVAPRGGW